MKSFLLGILIFVTLVMGGCGAGGKINGADTGTGNGTSGTGSVNYTVPNDGATSIGIYAEISIVFNQAMNPITVTDASFSVVCGAVTKNLSVAYDATNQAAKIGSSVSGNWGENKTCTVTAKGGSLRTAANNLMGEDYVFTFSTSSGSAVEALDLSASNLTLKTNGTDTIDFIVYAKDANNAAASNATVVVASTGGFLSANSVATGTTGQATFTLGVGNEKANRSIDVTLSSGTVVKHQTITISGTTLALSASKSVTTPSDATPIELTATLRDAAAQPIADATISFASILGNRFTAAPGYVFTSGSEGKTDSAGCFKVVYTGTSSGNETVTVDSSGATKNISLTVNSVSNAFFGFTVPSDPTIPVVVSTPTNLTVKWLDVDGNPKAGEILTLFASKGYFNALGTTVTTAMTNANGLAILAGNYNAGATAGPAEISVFDSNNIQTAKLVLDVRATTPKSINLQVTPGVIPVTTVTETSTSTLKATVRDVNNQAVAGKVVGFSIFEGPGSGEFISPVTAITDSGGVATSTFTAGSGTSPQDGVEVRATVSGVLAPATAKMTIAKSAATITIGTTNNLEPDGTTGYIQSFTVLVTDTSGGAIEGAIVSLSLVPIRFYTGFGVAVGSPAAPTGVYQTEDTNRNYILDQGEDCAQQLDILALIATGKYWKNGSSNIFATIVASPCTGNGRLDPGAVAAIDPTVTTTATGQGTFKVYYPKNFGNWVDVEITASTDVTGTNASAKIETLLNVIEDDHPHMPSPFGF